ncbi:restriction endonuclease subunit S [Klebsiella pneumoniae]|uniref:restriction endonuclease subunit S n=1 Tax=Klebsiella pneumoniae TaxID=573 RepID=UPI000E2AF71D|nr:restriction endonuclease subunit S [Klebsiella pneumoniae]SXL21760.1 type I restriction modification DNA specificity domain protein [Klebsiella pneumoniae]
MTVSKLRFPSPSSLVSHKLGALTRWSSGGTPSKANKLYWEGDISWFTAASMKSNKLSFSPTKISKLGLKNGSRLANKNDILLLVRGSMLFNKIPVGILLNDAAFNQDVKAIKCLGEFNHEFALQWFLSKEPHLLSMVTGTGIGAGKLDTSELQDLDVYLPDCKEQSRIANFLSCIDDKITLLDEQYVQLCQYKKGMMQKIFSQELRFKDNNGRDFPEWIKNSLGDIVTFFNGRAYKQTEWENNGIPVIRLQNLTGSGSEYYYSNLKLPDHQYCNYGDLLYMWSATMGPVWWKGSKAIFHYHIWKVISVPGKSTEDFIYYILDNITQKMLSEANGTTMAHITKAGIEKKIVNLPSIKEQIKIAKFLSAIDDKVSLKKAELDKLKTWKQGLLQQMFV